MTTKTYTTTTTNHTEHLKPSTDGQNESIARALFARAATRDKVQDAIVEYEERVENQRPYEDAMSIEDLRRATGR